MSRRSVMVVAGLAVAVLGLGVMTAQDREAKGPGKGPDREADWKAIEKLSRDAVLAFNNRYASAIAANWTDEGEYIRNDGEPIRGRAEVEKGYAAFFKTLTGKSTLEAQTDSLRFTSADTAVVEVTIRLRNEDGEVVASNWRNTLVVREGGRWKVAIVQEWDRDEGLDVTLGELDWLVGTWRAADKDREVTTAYEWDEAKAFIRGRYSVREGGKVVESGTQTIGKDNAEGAIRSWVFQSDGGFGDGLWTREGKTWSVDFRGVTPDGRELTATAVYVRVDANTYTWQSVDQAVDGEPIPDTQPVRVTRQKKGE
jgi:uncharacterized protein (TIGR02246 family)